MGRYTKLVDGIIVDCGGTVDKHIADAVMALFGAPVAHDDDPLRAARAALDVHLGLDQLSQSAARPLRAHIGIASGEVVAAALDRTDVKDYTVLGDSVNLAARLVAVAGPGQTLISDDVQEALRGRGVCDALGDMQFKGIDGAVRVWRLNGILGEEPSTGRRSPFAGRKAELEQFKEILSACLNSGGGQIVYVRGEAGIGKTRLVEEMRRVAEAQGFTIHRALVLNFGVGKSQGPIRAILRSLMALPDGAALAVREAAAQRALSEGLVASELSMVLHDLLDLPEWGNGVASTTPWIPRPATAASAPSWQP